MLFFRSHCRSALLRTIDSGQIHPELKGNATPAPVICRTNCNCCVYPCSVRLTIAIEQTKRTRGTPRFPGRDLRRLRIIRQRRFGAAATYKRKPLWTSRGWRRTMRTIGTDNLEPLDPDGAGRWRMDEGSSSRSPGSGASTSKGMMSLRSSGLPRCTTSW